jgi:hypothetical protein
MSETKFTPGPWSAVNVGTKDEPMMSVKASRISGRQLRHEVAICATGDSPQEMENANAHLIAAAPELYEALDALFGGVDDGKITVTPSKIHSARAALAKARGEA